MVTVPPPFIRSPPVASTATMARTLRAMRTSLTMGRPGRMSRKRITGDALAAPFTHSGHWNPTEAWVMQLGQIGRSHRWHVTPARRSAWR